MGYIVAAAEAVPVDPGTGGLAFSIVGGLLALLAVAVPVGILVGLLMLAGRVRRYGERLTQVEARLAAAEVRQRVEQ